MKPHIPLLAILLVSVVFVSGCTGPSEPKCPECSSPGIWSACTEDAVKARTNYKCGAETNYTCESYTEEKACATEMKIGGTAGLEAAINPTLDENVKGIIKVEAFNVPQNSEFVVFILSPQGVELGQNMAEEDLAKIIQEYDTSGADGWKALFDTTKVENGLYNILIGPTYENAPSENPWTAVALAQVVVKN